MKLYIASGNFRQTLDVGKSNRKQAVIEMFINDLTGSELIDNYVYVDERGCKDYISADNETTVFETEDILEECYHILEGSEDEDFEE
tara:strand:+ start:1885 stop:2145 length:261 start_codon:yes stop_codon:yes gene_type:complete